MSKIITPQDPVLMEQLRKGRPVTKIEAVLMDNNLVTVYTPFDSNIFLGLLTNIINYFATENPEIKKELSEALLAINVQIGFLRGQFNIMQRKTIVTPPGTEEEGPTPPQPPPPKKSQEGNIV